MALSAAIEWDVRTTGADTNGGGFKAGAAGSDYSQQNAAQKSGADLTMHAITNTKVLPVVAGVAAADVGNVVQITAGTNWTPGWYEITAQDGTYWTLDRSPAAAGEANLGTYAMGGALATPGKAGGAANVNFQTIHIKSGVTYAIAAGAANVSGQRLAPTNRIAIIGYQTTHLDLAATPVLQASASLSAAIITNGVGGSIQVVNIECDGNNLASTRGFADGGVNPTNWILCIARNCTDSGFFGGHAYRCLATGCTTAGAGFNVNGALGTAIGCRATANSVAGIRSGEAIFCVADANTGASTDGFAMTNIFGHRHVGCVAYNNGRHGFGGDMRSAIFSSCLAISNAGYGWSFDSTGYPTIVFEDCAAYNNTSGVTSGAALALVINAIAALTGNPFTNAAAGDFTLNNTAGAGAACRSVGWPGAIGFMAATGYADIGAYRHQDPAGGGGGLLTHRGMAGGFNG